MRWALLWMFVAGGAAAAAVKEARVPPLEVASADAEPRAPSAPIADVMPRPLPPARGFGGVPSQATTEASSITIATTDGESVEEGVEGDHDSGDCVIDLPDRCPDSPEDYDGAEDVDGCPEPYPRVEMRDGVEWEINRRIVDGRNIITESSIIIY